MSLSLSLILPLSVTTPLSTRRGAGGESVGAESTSNILIHLGNKGLLLHVNTMGKVRDIGGAKNLIGNHGDTLHNTANSLRAFHRVCDVLYCQSALEGDEVGLVLLDIALQFLRRVFACKRVGVVTIRQQQHLDIHTIFQEHIRTSHSRMDTSLITIIQQGDVIREAVQHMDLVG